MNITTFDDNRIRNGYQQMQGRSQVRWRAIERSDVLPQYCDFCFAAETQIESATFAP